MNDSANTTKRASKPAAVKRGNETTLKAIVSAINSSPEFKEIATSEEPSKEANVRRLGALLNAILEAVEPGASLHQAVDFQGNLCGVVLAMPNDNEQGT